MAYRYVRVLTIDHTKVPNTDQSSFPVRIVGTLASLATVANGGKVTSGSGFDINFYSDSGLTTALPYERVVYDPVTGNHEFHVSVTTVSHTSDTPIYMAYSDSGVTTDQSNKTGTWDANFTAVYHFGTGASFDGSDSTSNANNLTNAGLTATTDDQVGGALLEAAAGTSKATKATPSGTPSGSGPAQIEALFYPDENTTTGILFCYDSSASGSGFVFELTKRPTGVVRAFHGGGSGAGQTCDSSATYNVTAWNYAIAKFTDLTNRSIMVNGATPTTQAVAVTAVNAPNQFGALCRFVAASTFSNFFIGKVGEIRVSKAARSDDWNVATTNSVLNPSTFYSVGSETDLQASAFVPSSSMALRMVVTAFAAMTAPAMPQMAARIAPLIPPALTPDNPPPRGPLGVINGAIIRAVWPEATGPATLSPTEAPVAAIGGSVPAPSGPPGTGPLRAGNRAVLQSAWPPGGFALPPTVPRIAAINSAATFVARTVALPASAYWETDAGSFDYRVFIPSQAAIAKQGWTGQPYRVVIAWHGSGENGTDNVAQMTGSGNLAQRLGWSTTPDPDFPAIVVFPQRPASWTATTFGSALTGDQLAGRILVQLTMAVRAAVLAEFGGDPRRVYLTGLSAGGIIAFDAMYQYPNTFAAFVPCAAAIVFGIDPVLPGVTLSPRDNPTAAALVAPWLRRVPMRMYNSTGDANVPPATYSPTVTAITATSPSDFTSVIGSGDHTSVWTDAYADAGNTLYPWLWSQQLPLPDAPSPVGALSALELETIVGSWPDPRATDRLSSAARVAPLTLPYGDQPTPVPSLSATELEIIVGAWPDPRAPHRPPTGARIAPLTLVYGDQPVPVAALSANELVAIGGWALDRTLPQLPGKVAAWLVPFLPSRSGAPTHLLNAWADPIARAAGRLGVAALIPAPIVNNPPLVRPIVPRGVDFAWRDVPEPRQPLLRAAVAAIPPPIVNNPPPFAGRRLLVVLGAAWEQSPYLPTPSLYKRGAREPRGLGGFAIITAEVLDDRLNHNQSGLETARVLRDLIATLNQLGLLP